MRAWALTICMLLGQALGQTGMVQDHGQTLEQIRSSLRTGGSVDIGSVHLAASKSVTEMNLRDHVLMIVTDSYSGVLALFRSDGTLSDSVKLGTIVSSQVVDLNDGDTAGIAIDEVEGKGTGVVLRQFKLYFVSDASKLDELWHAPSFARKAPWSSSEPEPKVTTERGYLNFNRGGAGFPPEMSYAFCDRKGHWTTKLYKVSHSHVELIK